MLRHGQSEANVQGVISGSRDVALTDLGREQARNAIPVFRSLRCKPAIIVHSHRQRARETAEIVNETLRLEMIEDPRIAEQNFGDWEGQNVLEVRPHILAGEDPPNGETNDEFYERVREAYNDHLSRATHPVLFVCHGGLWRAIPALYQQERMTSHNCEPYLFHPNKNNAAFPWHISDSKAKGFQNALKPA
jgi:broad specificity phosphatase PhoE